MWELSIFLSSKNVRKAVTCVTNSINEISVYSTNTRYIIADITFLQDTFRNTAIRRTSSIVGFGSIWSRPTLTFKKKLNAQRHYLIINLIVNNWESKFYW